jgi:hypothetical protein
VMTKEEMAKIRCWIDLGVPSSGAYTEGCSGPEKAATEVRLANRKAWEALEKLNIEEFVRDFPSGTIPFGRSASEPKNPSISIQDVHANPITGAISVRILIHGKLDIAIGTPTLALHNAAGQCIRTFSIDYPSPGIHTIQLDCKNGQTKRLPSGFYIFSTTSQGLRQGIAFVWARM